MFSKLQTWCMVASLALASGCASLAELPVRTGTISSASASMRPVFKPGVGGAAAGAAIGGVAGHQVGKGRGKKVATVLGALAGATAGAAMTGTTEMVPTSMVALRDDATGEQFQGTLDGNWQPGMKLRFSVRKDQTIIMR